MNYEMSLDICVRVNYKPRGISWHYEIGCIELTKKDMCMQVSKGHFTPTMITFIYTNACFDVFIHLWNIFFTLLFLFNISLLFIIHYNKRNFKHLYAILNKITFFC